MTTENTNLNIDTDNSSYFKQIIGFYRNNENPLDFMDYCYPMSWSFSRLDYLAQWKLLIEIRQKSAK